MSAFARSPALAPFRNRNFRFQWPADLVTTWAIEMENLILGWYILIETGSVLLLTVFAAVQYLGTLLSPMFGVVGDRIGHGVLLAGMRVVYTVLSAALFAVIAYGEATPYMVVAITALLGCVRPSDLAVRSSLIADTMPPNDLVGAMSLTRTTLDTARIVGALSGAALFAVLGLAFAYGIVAALYAMGLVLTLCVLAVTGTVRRPYRSASAIGPAPLPAVRRSPWRDLVEGIAYVWATPQLLAAMWLAFLVNLTAFPFTNGLLPYVAREIYHIDQTGLGYLVASFAAGSLIATLVLSLATRRLWLARMMLVFAAAWYLLLLLFGQTESAATGVVLLALTGFAQSMSMVPLSVILLRTASENFRGRVMGVRMLAIYGLPLGLLAAGPLVDSLGFRATVTIFASIGLASVLAIAARWRTDLWPEQAPANAR